MSWMLGGCRSWAGAAAALLLLGSIGTATLYRWRLERSLAEVSALRQAMEIQRVQCEAAEFEAAQAGEAAALEINVTRGGSDAPRPGRHEL